MADIWSQIYQFMLDYGHRGVGALVVLVVGWLVLRFLLSPFRRLLDRSRLDPSVASFLASTARTLLLFVVFLLALNQLGVETASLVTLLGAVALAVALSLQGSLANFASGLVVLSFRIVRVGDVIETGDVRGRVTELLPFHAILVTADNQRVSVPNSTLTSTNVRNHSALPTRRAEWTLPLGARDDLSAVKEALFARLRSDPRISSEPPPYAFVKEWSDDKRVLSVAAWTVSENCLQVQQEMLEALGLRLEEWRRDRPNQSE